MQARIDDLRAQLEQANEANRENRRIIAALTSRIPELEAPQGTPQEEPRESPESDGAAPLIFLAHRDHASSSSPPTSA